MGRTKEKVWLCRGRRVSFGVPLVMGIVNVTPDSFYAGSRTPGVDEALARGKAQWQAGAKILDVGGESTRPGAEPVPEEQEIARVVPVLQALRKELPEALLSVDTRHTRVARAAVEAGADIINDVAGCTPDEGMWALVAETGAGYILMHARGNPKTMDALVDYKDVTEDVLGALSEATDRLVESGVRAEQIAWDPGLGFAKTHRASLELLGATHRFAELERPYLVAASRKRFLGEITGRADARARGAASLGAALWAIAAGADMVRVHDVEETVDAMRVFLAAKGVEHV